MANWELRRNNDDKKMNVRDLWKRIRSCWLAHLDFGQRILISRRRRMDDDGDEDDDDKNDDDKDED